jgi:hypothetical protein
MSGAQGERPRPLAGYVLPAPDPGREPFQARVRGGTSIWKWDSFGRRKSPPQATTSWHSLRMSRTVASWWGKRPRGVVGRVALQCAVRRAEAHHLAVNERVDLVVVAADDMYEHGGRLTDAQGHGDRTAWHLAVPDGSRGVGPRFHRPAVGAGGVHMRTVFGGPRGRGRRGRGRERHEARRCGQAEAGAQYATAWGRGGEVVMPVPSESEACGGWRSVRHRPRKGALYFSNTRWRPSIAVP